MFILPVLSRPFKQKSVQRVIDLIDQSRKEFSIPIISVKRASEDGKRLAAADVEVVTPTKSVYLQVQPFFCLARMIQGRGLSSVPLAIIVCTSKVPTDLLRMRIEEGLEFGYNYTT